MLPKSADVQIGDLVVTQGDRSLYPPDIPIGTVIEVSNDEPGLFKRVLIRPTVRLTILEEVFVMVIQEPPEFTLR